MGKSSQPMGRKTGQEKLGSFICSKLRSAVHSALVKESSTNSYMYICLQHRWARLLKQQRSITIDHLPTKENKLLFSIFRL
jgi:hypothetical protein